MHGWPANSYISFIVQSSKRFAAHWIYNYHEINYQSILRGTFQICLSNNKNISCCLYIFESFHLRWIHAYQSNFMIINISAQILTILATDILQSYCGNEAFLGYRIFDYNIRQGKCLSLIWLCILQSPFKLCVTQSFWNLTTFLLQITPFLQIGTFSFIILIYEAAK